MNRLSNEDRVCVIACLVEGKSIRSTVRTTGIAKNTIAKLLVTIGTACSKYQDLTFRDLKLNRIQCHGIWSFACGKQQRGTVEMLSAMHTGDVWTWAAVDVETKLAPCWMIGGRNATSALIFIGDLARRLAHRVQLTTNGHKTYLTAVDGPLGLDVDYAVLAKLYGESLEGQKRYTPAEFMGCEKAAKRGTSDSTKISASDIERVNLTMRREMRRFTRPKNAFSKKVENHADALALQFMYYNFVRKHQALKTSPAMAAGIANKLWTIMDLVALVHD